ncbi:shikimate O-hydroxycinnamoyltransferase-like protein [Tanacetum coccineum]
MVHEFVSPALSEDHFRGFIDWIYTKMKETDAEAVVVSSGQRFPVESINFGWGKPVFGSYHFPWGGQTGYVMPMPNVRKNGDWIVYMHLFQKHLDLVETKGSKVSKPLTPIQGLAGLKELPLAHDAMRTLLFSVTLPTTKVNRKLLNASLKNERETNFH